MLTFTKQQHPQLNQVAERWRYLRSELDQAEEALSILAESRREAIDFPDAGVRVTYRKPSVEVSLEDWVRTNVPYSVWRNYVKSVEYDWRQVVRDILDTDDLRQFIEVDDVENKSRAQSIKVKMTG